MAQNDSVSVLKYLDEKDYVDINIEDVLFRIASPRTTDEGEGDSFLEKYLPLLSQTSNGYLKL